MSPWPALRTGAWHTHNGQVLGARTAFFSSSERGLAIPDKSSTEPGLELSTHKLVPIGRAHRTGGSRCSTGGRSNNPFGVNLQGVGSGRQLQARQRFAGPMNWHSPNRTGLRTRNLPKDILRSAKAPTSTVACRNLGAQVQKVFASDTFASGLWSTASQPLTQLLAAHYGQLPS